MASPVVKRMPLESRQLVTWGEDHSCWRDGTTVALHGYQGAIYRLRPPAGTSDESIERVRAFLAKSLALSVKVIPPPRAAVVVGTFAGIPRNNGHKALRAVVEDMIAEANTENRDALRQEIEAALVGAGL